MFISYEPESGCLIGVQLYLVITVTLFGPKGQSGIFQIRPDFGGCFVVGLMELILHGVKRNDDDDDVYHVTHPGVDRSIFLLILSVHSLMALK